MADDDPYNFEIAIPSSSTRNAHGSSDGSEDVGGNSDDSDNLDSPSPPKRKSVQSKSNHSAPTKASSGKSSVLDKAKDFLSKYSSNASKRKYDR